MSTSIGKLQFDISRYERDRSLGKGAFSDVFLYRLRTGQGNGLDKLAIKMPREDHGIEDRKRDGEYLQGEAEVLRKLAADDRIVTLYYSGPHPLSGEPCLALEAFLAEDKWYRLDEIVSEIGLAEALKILMIIIQLLKVQQEKGIINPDLKLDSLFIKREPKLIVKATDFNTTTVGAPDSAEWQKVRRALAELMSYLLSQGRSSLFLAYTHDQQPSNEDIQAEEKRFIPPETQGLIIAALGEISFDGLEAKLKEAQQRYQAQLDKLVKKVLQYLEDGHRELARELLWESILKESLPITLVSKAKEQMAQGNVEPTLDLSQNLPPELKGVPWLTVWAHLVAPPASLIEERSKSETDFLIPFLPLYRHFLRHVKSSQMADALCSLHLLAPLPYDGSFALWIEERQPEGEKERCPVCGGIAEVRKELSSKSENIEISQKQLSQEINNSITKIDELLQKSLSPNPEYNEECKFRLEAATQKVKEVQQSPNKALSLLDETISDIDIVWDIVSDENSDGVKKLKDELAKVAKLAKQAYEPEKDRSELQSRWQELMSQLQKEACQW